MEGDTAAADVGSASFPVTLILPDGLGTELLHFNPGDVVGAVHAVLSSHPLTCAFTSYRLEFEWPVQPSHTPQPEGTPEGFYGVDVGADVGVGRVVDTASGGRKRSIPLTTDMPDITPFIPYLTRDSKNPIASIRIILEDYDVKRVRLHVRRLREVLANPPVAFDVNNDLLQYRQEIIAGKQPDAIQQQRPESEAALEERVAATMAEAAAEQEGKLEFYTRLLDEELAGVDLISAVALQKGQVMTAKKTLPNMEVPAEVDLGDYFLVVKPAGVSDDLAHFFRHGSFPESKKAGDEAASEVTAYQDFLRDTSVELDSCFPACLRSITFSGWNPAPAYRKMMGDLMYLRVETLEKRVLHITSTPTGFYLNKTVDPSHSEPSGHFDPTPASPSYASRTLWALLSRASPLFRKSYQQLLTLAAQQADTAVARSNDVWEAAFTVTVAPQRRTIMTSSDVQGSSMPYLTGSSSTTFRDDVEPRAHTPAATYGIASPPQGSFATSRSPWLVPPPSHSSAARGQSHSFDPMRAEDDALCTFGVTRWDALRDWNEEWQTCHELPVDTLDSKILRARAMYKVLDDFVEAATEGAMAIVNGHIAPLNASDDTRHHVFTYNNIFFSSSLDAFTKEKDRLEKLSRAEQRRPLGIIDPKAANEDMAALPPPNHDLHGVMAFEQAHQPGLHTLATAIISYAGHRFAAQTIIPGILAESASKLVYGSIDNGETVACDAEVHEKVKQIASKLHIAERTITPTGTETDKPTSSFQGAGTTPVPMAGAVECKGIRGSDGRHYLIDIVRITPKDTNFYDAEWKSALEKYHPAAPADIYDASNEKLFSLVYESAYVALLRPELVRLYAAFKKFSARKGDTESAETSAAEVPPVAEVEDSADQTPDLLLNVNAFTRTMKTCSKEDRENDDAAVRQVAAYLVEYVIPHVFAEIRLASTAPADGETLTKVLHQKGVNVRYLGALADLAVDGEQKGMCPPFVLELLESEMVARVARRLLERLLRKDTAFSGAAAITIAAFLNALLGSASEMTPEEYEAVSRAACEKLDDGRDVFVLGSKAAKGATSEHESTKRKKKQGKGAAAHGEQSSKSAAVVEADETSSQIIKTKKIKVSFPTNDVISPVEAAQKALAEEGLTHASLWAQIQHEVKRHFRYELRLWKYGGFAVPGAQGTAVAEGDEAPPAVVADPSKDRLERTAREVVLRRLCQRAGLQIIARSYTLPKPGAPSVAAVFDVADIAGFAPVVKSCLPQHPMPEAIELINYARAIADKEPEKALTVIQDASNMLYQVTAADHRDVAYCFQVSSLVMSALGDHVDAANVLHRSVGLYERLLGPDHPETSHALWLLASYLSTLKLERKAIRYMLRSMYITRLGAPASHPDVAQGFARLGVLYQSHKQIPMAIHCFFEAIKYRWDVLQQVQYMHTLALAYASIGSFREALQWELRLWTWYREKFGDQSELATEASYFVNIFTKKAVEYEKTAKAMQDAVLHELALEKLAATLHSAEMAARAPSEPAAPLTEAEVAELDASLKAAAAQTKQAKKAAKNPKRK